jgi:hypothetical protein
MNTIQGATRYAGCQAAATHYAGVEIFALYRK